MFDVVVIGGGPAGLKATHRAASLGANTALLTKDSLGGMAALDGPVPVRTLAHAARLVREARQLEQYGVDCIYPKVNYKKLLSRVGEVVSEIQDLIKVRSGFDTLGVSIYEKTGIARFVDAHTIETESGLRVEGEKFIICTGGQSRTLAIPGFEYTATHSDVWSLADIPESMAVVGCGATGAQVASIFNAFGAKVSLFEAAPRILISEDADVSSAVAAAFRASGIAVYEGLDEIESIEKFDDGFAFNYRMNGKREALDVSLVVMCVGWTANAQSLGLSNVGVKTDRRGYIEVNECLQTSAPHVFAAGDVNGQWMFVPNASQEGYFAATNAVLGPRHLLKSDLVPTGSFTDPEYAAIGLTEEQARKSHDCVVSVIRFDHFPRSIIDGRTLGFCKMIADRKSREILGCHVVGERAVETVQLLAAGMRAGIRIEQLAQMPLSFPTYVAIVEWCAADIARQLGLDKENVFWEPQRLMV